MQQPLHDPFVTGSKKEFARRFVTLLMEQQSQYHNHKEAMAYAGFTLYVAAFGAGLVSSAWPPSWPSDHMIFRLCFWLVCLSAGWVLALRFIGWQLHNRRDAALNVAAALRLLARWVDEDPKEEQLRPWGAGHSHPVRVTMLHRLHWFLWPPAAQLPQSDVSNESYPHAFVEAKNEQVRSGGTRAVFHEHLLIGTGWLLFVAVMWRTIAALIKMT